MTDTPGNSQRASQGKHRETKRNTTWYFVGGMVLMVVGIGVILVIFSRLDF